MTIKYVGGLCGDSKMCGTEYKIHANGVFEGHTNLTPQELSQLKSIIDNTDLLSYPANQNPKCESFFDGQDETYTFPQKYPNKTFTTCLLRIPDNDQAFIFFRSLVTRATSDTPRYTV
jgi:hypothetical protein